MASSGALALSDAPMPNVKLHPTAVVAILNAHMRRSIKNCRVIGTLLGTVTDNCVEITDCFGFPHIENSVDGKPSVSLDMAYANNRYSLLRRVNKVEQVVGWYATTSADGKLITDYSALIHECYSAQCSNPVHIVVDTTLTGDSINIRGFVSSPLVVDGRVLANVFDDVAVSLSMTESEVSCFNLLSQYQSSKDKPWAHPTITAAIPSSKDQIVHGLDNIIGSLDRLDAYIEGVIGGSKEPSPAIAETIEQTITCLQESQGNLNNESIADVIVARQHDLSMAAYLATLVQTQVHIAERINSIL